jgi:hypothetical protein
MPTQDLLRSEARKLKEHRSYTPILSDYFCGKIHRKIEITVASIEPGVGRESLFSA